MSLKRSVFLVGVFWVIIITLAHSTMNLRWNPFKEKESAKAGQMKLGFLPVTCHLTCPVTDYINKTSNGEGFFEPLRFNGFPELKEAFLSGYTQTTFILAPLAMALREQGTPIKIIYLGHRDGTAMVVNKESNIYRISDLKGKKVAVPNRYSNQLLLLYRALAQNGMTIKDIEMVEMPPPDMPAALYSNAVDAITSGEPFMGQTEMDGYGRVLYHTKDIWPGFISCVLAIHEDVIKNNREAVQQLVDGIARSGKWLDKDMDHRMQASQFVGKQYYNQDPKLLEFVLSKPPDRVKYTKLSPLRKDFEEIEALGKEAGILEGTVNFDDYVDDSFTKSEAELEAYTFQDPVSRPGATNN
ncbi:MAG: ABC transporter substrate-binding protein [Verrucomicrobiales bacterium]